MLSSLEYTRSNLKITGKCNYNCSHCYNDSGPESREFMPKNIAFRALELSTQNMVDSPLFFIHYTGGDPLEHPFFEDIVEYGTSLSKKIRTVVSTNDYHFKEDPGGFKETLEFLKNNRLLFIGFNSDLIYRNGSEKRLEELKRFCIENNVNPVFREPFDGKDYKPFYMGRAINNLGIEGCDTKTKSRCDEAIITSCLDIHGVVHRNIHITFNERGNVQYCNFCDFNIDGNPTVEDSNDKIIEKILNDPVRDLVTKENGLTEFFKIASSVTTKYDTIPPNCARFRAIQKDHRLLEKIKNFIVDRSGLEPETSTLRR